MDTRNSAERLLGRLLAMAQHRGVCIDTIPVMEVSFAHKLPSAAKIERIIKRRKALMELAKEHAKPAPFEFAVPPPRNLPYAPKDRISRNDWKRERDIRKQCRERGQL